MPSALTYPGVYIEEIPSGVRTITGVATSITAFVGRALSGPVNEPVIVNSFADYERQFGGLWLSSAMSFAVRDFFLNGGAQAIIVRLFAPTDAEQQTALTTAQNQAGTAADAIIAAAETARAAATAATTDADVAAAAQGAVAAAGAVSPAALSAATAVANAATAEVNTPSTVAADRDAVVTAAENAKAQAETAADAVIAAADAVRDAATPATTDADVATAAQGAVAAAGAVSPAALAVATAVANAATGAVGAADRDAVVTAAETAKAQAVTAADAVIAAADAARDAATPATTDADVAAAAQGAVAAAGAVSPAALAAATAVANAATAEKNGPSTSAADRLAVVTAAQNAKAAAVTAAAAASAPSNRARLTVGGLNLEAANEGAWGNDLRARIDDDVKSDPPNLFNLSVKNPKTGQIEVHRNLSVDSASTRRVDKVLAAESSLIRTRGTLPSSKPTASAPAVSAGPPPVVVAGVVPPGGDPFDTTYSTEVLTAGQASDGRVLKGTDFTTGESDKRGIYALLKADLFNLLCLPPLDPDAGVDMEGSVIAAAAGFCEKRRAMLLVDPPSSWVTTALAVAGINAGVGTTSKNAAIYFPRLRQPNPLRENRLEDFVPCGAVAGVMARTDTTRGVWKAPAGMDATLIGVPALTVSLTDAENGQLNPLGVNCLRVFPAAGRTVWGARTMEGNDRLASEWKYIPVRRTALFIEESLYRGTQWVVFEPNDEPLWSQIRLNLGAFMHNLFRQGAFQGTTPKDAYFVKCDKETTTQNDINNGVVNILVGFAPLKPAEFVVIKLQQMAGQIQT